MHKEQQVIITAAMRKKKINQLDTRQNSSPKQKQNQIHTLPPKAASPSLKTVTDPLDKVLM